MDNIRQHDRINEDVIIWNSLKSSHLWVDFSSDLNNLFIKRVWTRVTKESEFQASCSFWNCFKMSAQDEFRYEVTLESCHVENQEYSIKNLHASPRYFVKIPCITKGVNIECRKFFYMEKLIFNAVPGDRFIVVEGEGGKMELKKTTDYDPIELDSRNFCWKDVNGDVYK